MILEAPIERYFEYQFFFRIDNMSNNVGVLEFDRDPPNKSHLDTRNVYHYLNRKEGTQPSPAKTQKINTDDIEHFDFFDDEISRTTYELRRIDRMLSEKLNEMKKLKIVKEGLLEFLYHVKRANMIKSPIEKMLSDVDEPELTQDCVKRNLISDEENK